jgi:ureidoglycolate lyase
MNIPLEVLTPIAFAPYGQVLEQPARPPDALGPGWTWWGENLTLAGGDRPYAAGYLDLHPTPMTFDWAERHMLSDEMLIPTGGDIAVYVGPNEHPSEPGCLPELSSFRAFRVCQGQAVVLGRGVWHGAPLAIDSPLKVVVLLLKSSGSLDGYVVRFPETPVEITVGK